VKEAKWREDGFGLANGTPSSSDSMGEWESWCCKSFEESSVDGEEVVELGIGCMGTLVL